MSSNGGPSEIATQGRKKWRPNRDSRFLQQELPACKPLLTPRLVITIYMLVGVVFIPIGVFSLLASNSVVEIVQRYDADCLPANTTNTTDKVRFIQNSTSPKNCTRHIMVLKHMKKPIYVYYELDKYHQNHRRYVRSRSDAQTLKGDAATDTKDCKPQQNLGNNSSLPITPCGLIAWSLFNDTYNFTINSGKQLIVNKTGIAWKSDREYKFGANVKPKNFPNNINRSDVLIGGKALIQSKSLDEDEDLMVWMRTAAFPNFRKLYGRIEVDLDANANITININNVYNTYSFGGQKKLVLSTTSWIGGKNNFSGIAYITVGSISIFLAFFFFVAQLINPRRLGDINRLSWNKR
eukprot:c10986_g2_i1 orf=124-1176(+)